MTLTLSGGPRTPTFSDYARSAQTLARPSGIRSWRCVANSFGQYGFAGYTYALTLALEAPFTHVRAILGNASTSTPWTLDRCCAAPSAKINDGFTPIDAAGNPVSFSNFTTNNAGADGYVPSPGGSASSLAVPVATAAGVPALVATDWLPLFSLPRADGETLPLLMLRGYCANNANGPSPGVNYTNNWPAINQGRRIQAYRKTGDCVTTPANFTTPGQGGSGDFVLFAGVQTYQQGRGFNLMTLGDSLDQALYSTADANSFGFQACTALSTQTRPFSLINSGVQGQTTSQFFPRGYIELALFKPDVVVVPTASPNDAATTQVQFNSMLSKAIAFADACVRAGAVPILKTATPFALGYTSATDPIRQANNAIVRALGAAGSYLVLDADAAVSDGQTPLAHIRPEYLSAGNTGHINDAGHAAIAAMLVPMLASVAGR